MLRLNKEQEEAVKQTEGPVLILAGAGTGKTRVLVSRTTELLEQNLARPFECLLLTFTNKAAEEMRHRVAGTVGEAARSIWLSTFHRFGVRILRRHAERLGYGTNFIILSEPDQERLIKQVEETLKIDQKVISPAFALETISLLKDKGLTPELAQGRCDPEIEQIYKAYQAKLKAMNVFDFGDLLLQTLQLFQHNADILKSYQDQFRYIMVDEYQDTNTAQYLILRLMAQKHKNICCVGDEDQSIYSWRGAEISNILNFQKDFPDAKIIKLEQNYRSTDAILKASGKLIAQNKARIGKNLRVADGRTDEGIPLRIVSCLNAEDEAETVLRRIYELKANGIALKEMAILVRAAFQTRAFEDKLMAARMPYQILSGRKFYERLEIQDAVAYLRLLAHPEDDMAFLRVINTPKRGLGDAAIASIQKEAETQNVSLFEALKNITFKPSQQKTVTEFLAVFEKYKQQSGLPFYDMAHDFLEATGYIEFWRQNKAIEAETRVDNLTELFGVMQEGFTDIESFLEHVALVTDQDAEKNDDRITLMTLHAAKGLEFDAVFIPGLEEGVLPHQKVLEEEERSLEEERRLAYVGMTRARKYLMLSYAVTRVIFGQFQNNLPSRFLSEIGVMPKMTQAPVLPKNRPYYAGGFTAAKKTQSKNAFQPMDFVEHQVFGIGEVVDVEGDNLDIRFDVGIKKIKAGFVKKYEEKE